MSDGKLTRVRDEHSLVGKKSTGSKSKAGDEEGEEQRPVASAAAMEVQRRQENSKVGKGQKVTQKVWSSTIYKDPKT